MYNYVLCKTKYLSLSCNIKNIVLNDKLSIMNLRLFTLTASLAVSSAIFGQSTIKGTILGKDISSADMATAHVSLLQLPDSTTINSVGTEGTGKFVISGVMPGNYLLKNLRCWY